MQQELIKNENASFVEDLKVMAEDCKNRFDKLLGNKFLIIASLLDPRYTIQMEKLLGKRFMDFQDDFVTFIKRFCEQQLSNEQGDSLGFAEESSQNAETFNFWDWSDTNELNDFQPAFSNDFENQIEVNLNYFVLFSVSD